MNKHLALAALLALPCSLLSPAAAQDAQPKGAPSPNEIVAAAPASEWVRIAPEDLLVMTLAPDAAGNPRQVVIQLMPAPFSQGWVDNIRLFARSGWYDNISVNRVQDNYVVQWGDANYDNPEAAGEVKALPEGLKVMGEREYSIEMSRNPDAWPSAEGDWVKIAANIRQLGLVSDAFSHSQKSLKHDVYSAATALALGWPVATDGGRYWPVHCYGMIGVGRNYSPDTGSGAELYTVIGHAPRHLDRNIALVGRVIEGMEHLSSLPRGRGDLGFYADFESDKRTPIVTVRLGSEVQEFPQPQFEYLSTESETFARYADARANRRDPFFIVPAGGADICNIPVPIRRVVAD